MKNDAFLDQVRVAAACNARWEDMQGDERARFCGQCRKHVFNFSAMSAAEVESLIREKEGRLCGRFFRRADGRMLTADCPTGVTRRRNRAARWAGSLFATVLFFLGVRTLRSQDKSGDAASTGITTSTKVVKGPFRRIDRGDTRPLMGDVMAPVANTNSPRQLMGEIACTPSPTNPPIMGKIYVPPPPSTNQPAVMGLIAPPPPPANTNAPRATLGRIMYAPVSEKNPSEKAK